MKVIKNCDIIIVFVTQWLASICIIYHKGLGRTTMPVHWSTEWLYHHQLEYQMHMHNMPIAVHITLT